MRLVDDILVLRERINIDGENLDDVASRNPAQAPPNVVRLKEERNVVVQILKIPMRYLKVLCSPS